MNESKIKSIPLKLKEVDYGNEDLFEEYFKLINDAYFLELGNTGVAFKTKNRFTSKEIAKQTWKDTIVLRAFLENDNEEDGKEKKQDFEINSTKTIGFASFWPVKEDKLCIDLGPFAIDPKLKGKGYGTVFLNKIKDYCRNVLKKETLLIVVVNLRTDLFPFYERNGFNYGKEIPFNKPEETTRECCFKTMTFDLTQLDEK